MKINLSFFILLLIFSIRISAQNKIVAGISNFETNQGLCRACIFNSASSFKDSKPFQCARSTIANQKAEIVFTNIPDGDYAIFVFHDSNNNGKMDTNWLGIPKEGYGASQNKLPFATAPKFDANKFSLANRMSLVLAIKLRNL